MKRLICVIALITSLLSCNKNNQDTPDTGSAQKDKAVALLKSIATGDSTIAEAIINPNKYIQHNLSFVNGLKGFKDILKLAPRGSTVINPVRVYQDGDYVFVQTDAVFFVPQVLFDVFRFENGKIVEHWDNLQPKGTSPTNPSGHTMVDGPTEILDRSRTAVNKALVNSYLTDVLINGKTDRLAIYYNADNYIEHDPQGTDGLSNFRNNLQTSGLKYNKIHEVLGEGNFVLAVSEGMTEGNPTSYYDLFRLDNGKLAEHWNVIETIAPKSQWQNDNGKFNFPNE